MDYDVFRAYTIATLEAAAIQEKQADPNWQTLNRLPQAIRSLKLFFGYDSSQIVAL